MLDILFLLTLTLTGNLGFDIVIEVPKSLSSCQLGLRAGIDEYGWSGTIGPNILDYLNSDWYSYFTLQVSSADATTFSDICLVTLTNDPSTQCSISSQDDCYCDKYNATTGTAHFSVRKPSNVTFSQRKIRGEWVNLTNFTAIHSNETKLLPAIYNVTKADLTLSMNGQPVTCNGTIDIIKNSNNTLNLCCDNTAKPCYPILGFNGTTSPGDQSPCASYTFSEASVKDKQEFIVTQSYFVCTQNVTVSRDSCKIQIDISVAGNTTTPGLDHTTVTTPTTSSSSSPKTPIEICILCIVLPIVLGVCCIIVAIIICVCCKEKLCVCCIMKIGVCRKRKNAVLKLDPPDPPEKLMSTEVTRSSITLTWEPPESDGGAAITGYYLECKSLSSSNWVPVNKSRIRDTVFTVNDLKEGGKYEFRAMAENSVGVSKPSASTGLIKTKDPFAKSIIDETDLSQQPKADVTTNKVSQGNGDKQNYYINQEIAVRKKSITVETNLAQQPKAGDAGNKVFQDSENGNKPNNQSKQVNTNGSTTNEGAKKPPGRKLPPLKTSVKIHT